MSRSADEQAVTDLRGRIGRVLIARYTLGVCIVWAFAWGMTVLAMRVGWRFDRMTLLYGAAGLPVALLVGIVWALRKMPGEAAMRAAVDRHGRAGGLIMAADEVDTSAWASTKRASADGPIITWEGKRTWLIALASVAFVVAAFAIPDRIAQGLGNQRLDITDQAKPIEQQIALLQQEQIINKDDADSMRAKLDRIRQDARGTDPARTWESLDQMRHTLEQAAQKAAEDAVRQAEPLAKAESMAGEISKAQNEGKTDAQTLADVMRQLNDQVAAAGKLQKELSDQTKKELANGEKPESHYQLDIKRAEHLIEKAKELEHLAKIDPKDISPTDAVKLAALAMELKKLDEKQLKQLAALGATDQMLKRLPPDSIAVVDAKADAKFYTHNPKQAKLPDMSKPQSFAARVNAGPTPLEMFDEAELDAAHKPLFDWPADLFEGQPLAIEHSADGKLLVFSGLPSTPVDWDKLDELKGEHIIAVEGGKQPQLFGPVDVPPCNGQCTGQASKVAKAVRMQQQAMLQQLIAAGMIDPSRLDQFKSTADQALQSGMPGAGGISRGRGDADLTWKDPANTDNVKMQTHTLPPATLAALKDSQQLGVSGGAPQTEDMEASTGGALTNTAAGGGEANTAVILPEHRAAVQRYFQRE